MGPVIYKCPLVCPLRKRCFILKTVSEIEEPLEVLVKCAAQKGEDVEIAIGGDERPP